ncbi:MAG: sigma-70 family RNA polymerase sigma factor [Niameybacter sp.]|uniref:sigma-70 family RNA polymerase sigma factor n=1 Tax=Niameybacter sp. TaxID=2033640 RepID=UPI002FC99E3C
MDKKEFAQRVEGLKKQLYKIAYLYLGSEASALEAVDEAVYKGLKAMKQLREPEYFNTWMTRILINECKRELKHMSKLTSIETSHLEKEAYDYDALPLKEAIAKLPVQLREVVILRYFSGYTLSEVAETLDMPQGTVVTRQRRALQLLKLELREEA